jgi:sulfofructose kinase
MASDLQIIGLGMATLDLLIRLEEMPTWERGTAIHDFALDGGGPVATAMVAAARLGARVGFVGTAGSDEAAELKLRSLREAGVDLRQVVHREAPEDQIVLVCVHAGTGERVFSTARRWGSSTLGAEEIDRSYITSADYLHLDGFHSAAALAAAKWARKAGKAVVLDGHEATGAVVKDIHGLLEYVTVLISGSGFAEALTGLSNVQDAAAAVLDMGPGIFVQTEADSGCYTVTREECFHSPAFEVDVIDTTGAGDVFHGAYLVGLLHGWDLERVARFSNAAAAMNCTVLGGRSGIPRYPEVLDFLRKRGIELEE